MAQKMEIYVRRLPWQIIPLKVDPHETLVNVKNLIHENEGIPPDQIKLLYAGKVLNDYDLSGERKTLYHYNIQKESTINMRLSLRGQSSGHSTEPVSDTSAAESYKAWETKAKEGDFDQDLHIVDSQSHFHLLKQLERQVVARSEFCQAKGKYDIHKISDPDLISQPQNSLPDLPTWLLEKLDANMPKWKVLVDTETKLEKFQHLWKSYTILSNVSRGITQMMALQFCTDSINILMRHSCKGVIEIKRLDLILIEDIKTSVETAISLLLEDLNEDTFINFVRLVGLSPCERLLKHLGYEDIETKTTAPEAALGLLRKTVLLLDMALISYVRSHGSGFDTPGLGSKVKFVEVSEGEDSFAFKCSWMKLTCLDAFLDGRQVWVFEFLNPSPVESHLEQDITPRPTSVLTRMRDLADIWGPVYNVPTPSGLVKHYVVSNGVICRVNTKQQCTVPGAVQCHYYSRPSFLRRKAYKLMSKEPELLLAEDDVLLIGGGLKENRYCKYKMSDFARGFASDFMVLGTKESVWKTDSRSAAIGVSKFFGITMSGSQKLIPQTTLKQHILDKWTANPLRANPAIFNHYLGVQLSHCTGNARRVSLRELMISDPIWEVLERQTPGWTSTPWGSSFKRALFDYDREAIFQVWKDFASDRANFAGLLCCLLELLDCTGLVEGKKFHAAMLYENEEYALPIHTDINDWSIPLRDTHITAAYVIINEICLNCEVPNHSTSSCHIQNAYTVLQTQFATERPSGASRGNETYILRPDGQRFKQVDGGSSDIFLLTSASLSSNFLNLFNKTRDCAEVRDQFRGSTTNTVYIRASNRSFHGKNKPKSNVALEHTASLEEERRGSGPHTRQSIHNQQEESAIEDTQNIGIQLGGHFRSQSDESPQTQPAAPLSSRPHIPSGVDGSLIMSDVYGQSVYPNRPGGHSILDDVANHEL